MSILHIENPNIPTMMLDYPRLRYMGSKYKIIPHLHRALSDISYDSPLDAFSGSGVVAYYFKTQGKEVTANDFMHFPATITKALVENNNNRIEKEDLDLLLQPNSDDRHFIIDTFKDLYFPDEDHLFMDALWSNLHRVTEYKRALALSALFLAAARKQPRGVFTITDFRYDDGRAALRQSMKHLFLKAVQEYNSSVFDNGRINISTCSDVFNLDASLHDLVYMDPPYAPLKDDADYTKRYHFLEGLSVYWEGMKLMQQTKTKKIEKIKTPFASKKTVEDAMQAVFHKFRKSIIVLSYSANSVPDQDGVLRILGSVKKNIEIVSIPHKYSFGTHQTALKRDTNELIFIAK